MSIQSELVPFDVNNWYTTYFRTPGLVFKLTVVDSTKPSGGIAINYTSGPSGLSQLTLAETFPFPSLEAATVSLASNPSSINMILIKGNYTSNDEVLSQVPNLIIASFYNFQGSIPKYTIDSTKLLSLIFASNGSIVNLSIINNVDIKANGSLLILGSTISIFDHISFSISPEINNVILSSSIEYGSPLMVLTFISNLVSVMTIAYSTLSSGTLEDNFLGSIFGITGVTGKLDVNIVASSLYAKEWAVPGFASNIAINLYDQNVNTNNSTDIMNRFSVVNNLSVNMISAKTMGAGKLNLSKFNKYFVLDSKAEVFNNSSLNTPFLDVTSNYQILPTDNSIYVNSKSPVTLTLPNTNDIEPGKQYLIVKNYPLDNVTLIGNVAIEVKRCLVIPRNIKSITLRLNNSKSSWIISDNSVFI